jgi:hypothetical protein
VLVKLHVNFPAAEGDAFSLEPEALFEGVVSAQLYGASGAYYTLPRQADGTTECSHYLAGGARKSSGFRDCAISGDLSVRNAASGGHDFCRA